MYFVIIVGSRKRRWDKNSLNVVVTSLTKNLLYTSKHQVLLAAQDQRIVLNFLSVACKMLRDGNSEI